MKQFLFLVLSIYLIGIIFYFAIFYYQLKPLPVEAGLQNQTTQFIVQKGDGFKEIAERLEEQNLIRSSKSFKVYLLINGWANKLQPGVYQIAYGSKASDIAKLLMTGSPTEKTVVIPEGYTLLDIEQKLKNEEILGSGESLLNLKISDFQKDYYFLKDAPPSANLEGFLFPDTYRFKINSPATLVVKRMLDNFQSNLTPEMQTAIANTPLNFYQIVTLASLIEGEIPNEEERSIVAGILVKRLENQMPLQVDATIIYIKCDILKTENCRQLSPADFKIESPYNTYQHLGLPKGPINNPGQSAIKAALNPVESPYWYYLSDPKTGKTIFSKTLKEHNEARAKYLK
ncbi:MAG TPA: endolytic transglycosylase MltG [Candidatus Paceibacterota bacterium]|nr:endolytic transglycosylase MltG [Candidatus Paceibacterota bacterium]